MNEESFTRGAHRATAGAVYPGMGNPTEYYPKCSCGWRGFQVINFWSSAEGEEARFGLYGYDEASKTEGGLLIPDHIIAPGRTYHLWAYKQVLTHLGTTCEELAQGLGEERAQVWQSLRDDLARQDREAMAEGLHVLNVLDSKEELLTYYREAEALIFDFKQWTSPRAQTKLEEEYEADRKRWNEMRKAAR